VRPPSHLPRGYLGSVQQGHCSKPYNEKLKCVLIGQVRSTSPVSLFQNV
jgi:hypothetical protein